MECGVHELAERTFSSASTIIRMCRRIGFDGYKDFRRAVTYEAALRRHNEEEEQKDSSTFRLRQMISTHCSRLLGSSRFRVSSRETMFFSVIFSMMSSMLSEKVISFCSSSSLCRRRAAS